jgi:cardiolipin synthase
MILKQLPNLLTLLRFFLIMPFLFYFYQENYANALYLFLVAGFTDALDGWLARQFRWQSTLGLFLDPIADKLLIAASFISLGLIHRLPWWLIELVFFRDVSILFGVYAWHQVMQGGLNFKPTVLSKVNTAIELFLVSYCLAELVFAMGYPMVRWMLIGTVALTTTASYVQYMWTWAKKASINPLNLQ